MTNSKELYLYNHGSRCSDNNGNGWRSQTFTDANIDAAVSISDWLVVTPTKYPVNRIYMTAQCKLVGDVSVKSVVRVFGSSPVYIHEISQLKIKHSGYIKVGLVEKETYLSNQEKWDTNEYPIADYFDDGIIWLNDGVPYTQATDIIDVSHYSGECYIVLEHAGVDGTFDSGDELYRSACEIFQVVAVVGNASVATVVGLQITNTNQPGVDRPWILRWSAPSYLEEAVEFTVTWKLWKIESEDEFTLVDGNMVTCNNTWYSIDIPDFETGTPLRLEATVYMQIYDGMHNEILEHTQSFDVNTEHYPTLPTIKVQNNQSEVIANFTNGEPIILTASGSRPVDSGANIGYMFLVRINGAGWSKCQSGATKICTFTPNNPDWRTLQFAVHAYNIKAGSDPVMPTNDLLVVSDVLTAEQGIIYGQVLKTSSWSGRVSELPPPITGLTVIGKNESVEVFFEAVDDEYSHCLGDPAYIVTIKQGAIPANPKDGQFIELQHQSGEVLTCKFTGLTNDVTYWVRIFPMAPKRAVQSTTFGQVAEVTPSETPTYANYYYLYGYMENSGDKLTIPVGGTYRVILSGQSGAGGRGMNADVDLIIDDEEETVKVRLCGGGGGEGGYAITDCVLLAGDSIEFNVADDRSKVLINSAYQQYDNMIITHAKVGATVKTIKADTSKDEWECTTDGSGEGGEVIIENAETTTITEYRNGVKGTGIQLPDTFGYDNDFTGQISAGGKESSVAYPYKHRGGQSGDSNGALLDPDSYGLNACVYILSGDLNRVGGIDLSNLQPNSIVKIAENNKLESFRVIKHNYANKYNTNRTLLMREGVFSDGTAKNENTPHEHYGYWPYQYLINSTQEPWLMKNDGYLAWFSDAVKDLISLTTYSLAGTPGGNSTTSTPIFIMSKKEVKYDFSENDAGGVGNSLCKPCYQADIVGAMATNHDHEHLENSMTGEDIHRRIWTRDYKDSSAYTYMGPDGLTGNIGNNEEFRAAKPSDPNYSVRPCLTLPGDAQVVYDSTAQAYRLVADQE